MDENCNFFYSFSIFIINFIAFSHQIKLLQKKMKHLPVLALTADVLNVKDDKFIKAGMDGYIAKPIVIDELLSKIYQFSPIIKQGKKTDVKKDIPISNEDAVKDKIFKSLKNNHILIMSQLKLILEEVPKKLSAANNAFIDKNTEKTGEILHSLKGVLFLDNFTLDLLIKTENIILKQGIDVEDAMFKTLNESIIDHLEIYKRVLADLK